jgi:hypothetical protein
MNYPAAEQRGIRPPSNNRGTLISHKLISVVLKAPAGFSDVPILIPAQAYEPSGA